MITFSEEILDAENPMQLFADIAMREAEQEREEQMNTEGEEDSGDTNKGEKTEEKKDE